MMLTDEEIRTLAINLLKLPTDRDRQTRIGASNLSNGCDRCLGFNFLGDDRSSAIADRSWMGAVLGTSIHTTMENRVNEVIERMMAELLGLNPDAIPENHVFFADIRGYGQVGGTIDLDLLGQIVDWKGTTRKKLCILIDYLEISEGRPAIFGRSHTWVKLSEKEYAAEMEKMAYKVTGYYGQQTLYMHGSGAKRASLVFITRDGTGTFDNPAGARYLDPKVIHDVYVLSFDYDQAYAEALITRGQAIWDHLEAGGTPLDLADNPLCFVCSQEAEDAAKNANIEVTFPQPELVAA